jgi:hypothetical protein
MTGEAGGVVNVQLLHQALPMFFNRLDADASSAAVALLALPSAISCRTSISRKLRRGRVFHPFFH